VITVKIIHYLQITNKHLPTTSAVSKSTDDWSVGNSSIWK